MNSNLNTNAYAAENPDLSAQSQRLTINLLQRLLLAAQLFLFLVGFIVFEQGAVRKKNVGFVVYKHMLILCTSAISVFIFGFAFAFGSPYLIGTKYVLSTGFLWDDSRSLDTQMEMLGTNYLILILLCAISSSIACAAFSERVTIGGQVILTVVVANLIVPLVTAWTLGKGILSQLYFTDNGACLSLHLTSGFIAMVLCYQFQDRLGHYEPLLVRRQFLAPRSQGRSQ